MDHFPVGDWIDFARGVLPAARAELLQSHLRQGCAECLRSFEIWSLVASSSAKEPTYHPPDHAVDAIKGAYASARPERWLPEIAQFARLIFDSFKQPELAMVRGPFPSSRLLLHEAAPFTIDLRLDSDPLRKRFSLMGQILNSRDPEQSANGIDIILLSGDRLVQKTSANAAGEFDLDLVPEDNLQLFVNIRGQRAIAIALPDMGEGR
jgi:hypothetical protein